MPLKMKAGLCALVWCAIGASGERTAWEQDMAAGKLPEMTLSQQMQLFGAHIVETEPPPTVADEPITVPAPWWRSVDEGNMPQMSDQQKMMLFGSSHVVENFDSYDYYGEEGRADKNMAMGDARMPEGRGRMKKILVPVLLALTIIAAIVLPALMTVIKLIAVKGLWSGLVSLFLTKLVGLKALLDHHHHHPADHSHSQRPLLVYLPHAKHRREEEDGWATAAGAGDGRQPYDEWAHADWVQQLRRADTDAKL